MENEYLRKVREVASAFNADNAGNIFFNKQLIFPKQPRGVLSGKLAGFIYSNCYCRNSIRAISPTEMTIGDSPDDGFIDKLIAANTTTGTASAKWQIVSYMHNGDPVVSKGTDAFSIHQSEITTAFKQDGQGQADVSIKNQKDYNGGNEAFYHVFSDNPENKKNGPLLRFYWNIKPQGAPLLINKISSGFNNHFIPFQFKCLKHPALYSRHDAGVLYILPRYLNIAGIIIRQMKDEVKPFLNEEVPMFTLKLWDGLSFAESPASGQSFGMAHASIISDGLLTAFEQRLDDIQKIKHITGVYQSLGYDLACPYKNPGSTKNYICFKLGIN